MNEWINYNDIYLKFIFFLIYIVVIYNQEMERKFIEDKSYKEYDLAQYENPKITLLSDEIY